MESKYKAAADQTIKRDEYHLTYSYNLKKLHDQLHSHHTDMLLTFATRNGRYETPIYRQRYVKCKFAISAAAKINRDDNLEFRVESRQSWIPTRCHLWAVYDEMALKDLEKMRTEA